MTIQDKELLQQSMMGALKNTSADKYLNAKRWGTSAAEKEVVESLSKVSELYSSKQRENDLKRIEALTIALKNLYDHAPDEAFFPNTNSDFENSFKSAIINAKKALNL